MVQLYYGFGKGKTSAAAGAAVRAAGNGMRVIFAQFFKDGKSGEIKVLRDIPGITVVLPKSDYKLLENMTDMRKKEIFEDYTKFFRSVFERENDCDMIILDEALDAYTGGFIDRELFLSCIKSCHDKLEIIVTGHAKSDDIADAADYVTEFTAVRHPYEKGVKARRGIEY